MYRVELTPQASKELDRVPADAFERLDAVLAGLAREPRPRGARKLRGPIHRLRVGPWRVVYAIFERDELVLVGKITRRSEDTYDEFADLF